MLIFENSSLEFGLSLSMTLLSERARKGKERETELGRTSRLKGVCWARTKPRGTPQKESADKTLYDAARSSTMMRLSDVLRVEDTLEQYRPACVPPGACQSYPLSYQPHQPRDADLCPLPNRASERPTRCHHPRRKHRGLRLSGAITKSKNIIFLS